MDVEALVSDRHMLYSHIKAMVPAMNFHLLILTLDRGCITPEVLHNWHETCQMDMELVDGYDELAADSQAKVKRALEQKHVDDEDFNGVSRLRHL